MLRVMLRPRWLLALALALAVAAAFALLGQWQLERSVITGEVTYRDTETPVALTEWTSPTDPVTTDVDGQRVTVQGHFDPRDYDILTGRLNGGEPGFWLVGHFVVDPDSAGLAVGLGWSADRQAAEDARRELTKEQKQTEIAGRYLATEAPEVPPTGAPADQMTTMSVAALINLWHDFDEVPVYGGYLVLDHPPAGLTTIDSVAPEPIIAVNWLNIFYAAEWAIFAGFAIFFWYRLAKDAWLREQELAEIEAREAETAGLGAGAQQEPNLRP